MRYSSLLVPLLLSSAVSCGAKTPLGGVEASVTVAPGAVVSVSVGRSHVCAARGDGRVLCWGDNSSGQLGDGTQTDRTRPVLVPGLESVVEVAAGGLHTCARLEDGTLRCWGSRTTGQTGDGLPLVRTTIFVLLAPTNVPGVSGATQVAAGDSHTCAVVSGAVWCFGTNDFGELGDGRAERNSNAHPVLDASSVDQVSLGTSHSCARLVDSTLRCWGSDEFAQLGASPETLCGGYACARRALEVKRVSNVAQVALAGSRTCAIVEGGAVHCFGLLNDGLTTSARAVPGLTGAVELSLGRSHACARKNDGTVWCWGEGDRSQLGYVATTPCPRGSSVCSLVPQKVLDGARKVAVGGDTSCAIRVDGTLWCWGRNDEGQLGDGTTADRVEPKKVTLP